MRASLSRGVVVGLVAGALVRLLLIASPGTPDVGTWKAWAAVGSEDATGLYGVGGTPPERGVIRWRGIEGTTEYPPLALYELAATGRAYRALDPAFEDTPALTAFIKLPGLLAEAIFVLAVLLAGPSVLGLRATRWLAMAFWLNPAIVLNGAALGYLDAQMAVPAALAMLAAATGWPALAGVLAATAVLTKAQAVFVGPAILLAIAGQARMPAGRAFARFTVAGLVTAALIVAPVAIRGALPNMVQAIERLGAHDMVSGYATNAWWIVTWFVRSAYGVAELGWWEAFTLEVRILGIERIMEVGYPNPKLIGAAFVLGWLAWACWRAREARALADWAFLGGWSVFTYFVFAAQVHENHLYLAVPVLALAAAADARVRPLFWGATAVTALNMYVFYGLGYPGSIWLGRHWTGIDLTVILSAVAVVIWWRGARRIGDPYRTVSRNVSSSASA